MTQLLTVQYTSECTTTTSCISAPNAAIAELEAYAEAVNNSLAALPSGAISGQYVWTTGHTLDVGGDVDTAEFYPNSLYSGTSVAVDSLEFRLDTQIVPTHCYDATLARTANHISGTCTFIKLGNPGKQNAIQVKGWYTPQGEIDGEVYTFETINFGATDLSADTHAARHGPARRASCRGRRRAGRPRVERERRRRDLRPRLRQRPRSGRVLQAWCVRLTTARACKCFSGYSGVRCDTQNSISFSF